MTRPRPGLHLPLAAFALFASLQPLAGCAAPEAPPDEVLRRAFPDQAAAVLSVGPGFLRNGGGLERAAAARHGGVAVSLPAEGSEAIVFELAGGATLRVREVGAGGEAMLTERAVVYRRAGGSSFWTATPDGVEEWLLLEAEAVRRDAPVAAWEVEGGALAARDGAIEIADAAGVVRLRVTAPAAYAAGGREVDARLAARGARIELFVDAEGEQVLVDPAWVPAGSMGFGRRRHAMAELGTRLLVAGGLNQESAKLRTVEIYDPADGTWSPPAEPGNEMRTPRADHAIAALHDGRFLAVGGDVGPMGSTYELYDPEDNTWGPESPPAMGVVAPLYQQTVTVLPAEHAITAGDVLIVGGTSDLNNYTPLRYVFRFFESTDTMTRGPDLEIARTMHAATRLATGEILVTGGYDNPSGLRSTELYDPATNTWAPGPMMRSERYQHTATLLQDGDVLVVGHSSGAEIYTPGAPGPGAFSEAGSFENSNRFRHSATLLPNGCVLVAGGQRAGISFADTWLYDPVTTGWTGARPLIAARSFHTATLLDDGSVLITGGEYRDSAEIRRAHATSERYVLGQAGEACGAGCECQTGFCVDGVCCDTACEGACDACAEAAGASADGTCSPVTGRACDDGNDCTSDDACDAGTCAGEADDAATCDDGNECTRDACSGGECVGTPDDAAACGSQGLCTISSCRGGACVVEAITCEATDECHTDGACNEETGACVPRKKVDGAPCEGDGTCLGGRCDHVAAPATSSSSQGGEGGAGGGVSPPQEEGGPSCDCRVAGPAAPGGGAAALLLTAAAASRAARRRRRPCPTGARCPR
ncbi:Kelch repeat-containing protein [Sorangium sp. So ce887]|uniref:Kelch repeat-containing protein n=1 Tax=Sorangium sp. So ce887 TaxID=3133324 RepID=UPI003F644148